MGSSPTEIRLTLNPSRRFEAIDVNRKVQEDAGDLLSINACGAWSPSLAKMIGVDIPTYPIRHEICSSEPLKPFLRPMVSELASGLYCSQSMRGESLEA